MQKAHKLLGDWTFSWTPFRTAAQFLQEFSSPSFRSQESRKRFKEVNKALLHLIQKESAPCFLLPQVIDFITHINSKDILDEPYSLSLFEFWLNHFSKLSLEENLLVRGKIAGRHVPRDEYQRFFPVGLGKTLSGSHFVAAHLSPDVDTTVSSFWSWLDAFACRLAEGIHYWSLPKGLTDGHIQQFFQKNFGDSVFETLSRPNPALSLTAMDLVSQQDLMKVPLSMRSDSINHGAGEIAVVLIDNEGMYSGEWRSQDAEVTRQVVDTLISALRWLKNTSIVHLIEALSKDPAYMSDAKDSIDALFRLKMEDCEAIQEMNDRSKKQLQDYMRKCLKMHHDFQHTFDELLHTINTHFKGSLDPLFRLIHDHAKHAKKEESISHAAAMQWLETMVSTFESCLKVIRGETKTLYHLLDVKQHVLEYPTTFVTLKSDIEEMRLKMGSLDHLTVAIPEKGNGYFPVGIVRARDLHKPVLGTASLRDFSSLEETKSASYIDIISIIDHHKTNIKTTSVSTLLLGDAQSTNTLTGECTLEMNEEYQPILTNPHEVSPFWVAKEREMLEYFSQIYAILDDTDLLSKVSKRDLKTVIALINRMKSLMEGEEGALIALPKACTNHQEVKKAAQTLLQNKELHSIYKKVYHHKEKEVSETLLLASERKPSPFFSDTKEQNGCCRIGQTKLFHSNLSLFADLHDKLRSYWIDESISHHRKEPLMDFFLHMISTIQGEKEIMQGGPQWKHQDELWIWIPEGDIAIQHVITFLNNFNFSEAVQAMPIEVVLEGKRAKEFSPLISQNLTKAHGIETKNEKAAHSVIVIRFPAGLLNSRKSQITPFLPKLVS